MVNLDCMNTENFSYLVRHVSFYYIIALKLLLNYEQSVIFLCLFFLDKLRKKEERLPIINLPLRTTQFKNLIFG